MPDDILKPYEIDQPLTEWETKFVESNQRGLLFGLTFKKDRLGNYYLDLKPSKSPQGLIQGIVMKVFKASFSRVQKSIRFFLLQSVAVKLSQQGDYSSAAGIFGLMLRLGLSERGVHHPSTLMTLGNIASCLHYDLGRFQEALPWFESTYKNYKSLFGERHPNTLFSLSELANCLQKLGRSKEALPLHQLAYNKAQSLLGEQNPKTLLILNNFAVCLREIGRAEKALSLFQSAYKNSKLLLGEKHPTTTLNSNGIANCLYDLGRIQEALPWYQSAYKNYESVFGERHPNTLLSLSDLAICLQKLGRFKEALPLYQLAYNKSQSALDEQHPNALVILNNFAVCLREIGRVGEALPLFQSAYKSSKLVLGEKHLITLMISSNIASCLSDLGRIQEALPWFQSTYKNYKCVFGKRHRHTLFSLSNLATCLFVLGRAQETLSLHQLVYDSHKLVLGEEHPDTLKSLDRLAIILRGLGRAKEALPLLQQAYDSFQSVFGEKHPNTLNSLNNLAICLSELGHDQEALSQFQLAYEGYRSILGEFHLETLGYLNNLVSQKQKLGDDREFLKSLQEIAELLAKTPMRYGEWTQFAVKVAINLAEWWKPGMKENYPINWVDLFRPLSHVFVEVLDLQYESFLQKARQDFSTFHAIYLRICLLHKREDIISQILSAIQGRKIAAWILNELENPVAGEVKDAEVKRFLELRTELRRLALVSQQIVTGGRKIESSNRHLTSEQIQQNSQRQLAEYQAKLDEYHSLLTKLAQREDFQVINPQKFSVNLNTLQAKLLQTEAILLLIDFKDPIEETKKGIALIITQETQCRVDLKGLSQLAVLTRKCESWRETRAKMRLTLSREDKKPKSQLEEIITERQLQEKIENDLWKPLYKHLEGIEHLHIVTHGDLHIVPYELGGAPSWVTSFSNYPGLVFYYKLRHLRSEQNLINEI